MRVLVVEDQWHVANVLKSLIQSKGMVVNRPAGTIVDARRLASEYKPELAVVDLNLKGEMAYSLIDTCTIEGLASWYSPAMLLPRLTEKVVAVPQKPCKGPEVLAALLRALQGCHRLSTFDAARGPLTMKRPFDGNPADAPVAAEALAALSASIHQFGASADNDGKGESARWAREILSGIPAAIYTTDADGYLTYYNERAAELWGYRPEIGKQRWCGTFKIFLMDGTPVPHDQCPMATAVRTGKPIALQA